MSDLIADVREFIAMCHQVITIMEESKAEAALLPPFTPAQRLAVTEVFAALKGLFDGDQ